jgi:hypothetical protein
MSGDRRQVPTVIWLDLFKLVLMRLLVQGSHQFESSVSATHIDHKGDSACAGADRPLSDSSTS